MADAAVEDFIVESNTPTPAEAPPANDPPPPPSEPAPSAPADPSPDGVAEPPGTGDETPEGEPDAAASTEGDVSEAGRKLAGKKKSLQQRLNEVAWEREEQRRRAEQLEAQLREREQATQPAPGKTKPQLQVDPNDPPPSVEQFETYEEFVDERAAWRARQEFRALRERDERESAVRAYQTRLSELEQKGTETHADFVPVLEQFAQSGQRFNPFVTGVIQNHELGHEIAYALASDPQTFQRITYARTFEHAAVEMGKLIARLEAAPTGSASPAVTVTRAKAPISPVGSSPVVSEPDPDSLDLAEYVRLENEKERARRRR